MKLLAPLSYLAVKSHESLEGSHNSELNPSCSDNLRASRTSSLGPSREPPIKITHGTATAQREQLRGGVER